MENTMASSGSGASVASEEVVSRTIRKGFQDISIATGVGLAVGGLASIVLVRGGGSARKAITTFGGGVGLGHAWTRCSMELESILEDKKK
jgi:hypothetical protein